MIGNPGMTRRDFRSSRDWVAITYRFLLSVPVCTYQHLIHSHVCEGLTTHGEKTFILRPRFEMIAFPSFEILGEVDGGLSFWSEVVEDLHTALRDHCVVLSIPLFSHDFVVSLCLDEADGTTWRRVMKEEV